MNDCSSRFSFRCPNNGVVIHATYNHMSGRLDLGPGGIVDEKAKPGAWDEAVAFCDRIEGNYFYMHDVRKALKDAGVDTSGI